MNNTMLATHALYARNIDLWNRVDDVCNGQKTIKDNGKKYLPMPKSFGESGRYDEYLSRAVFYGVTGVTLNSYIGSAFNKLPAFNRPDELEYLLKNADGAGRSIYQVSQKMLRLVMMHYRCGVYVDYPQVAPSRTKADERQKNAYPMIHVVDARSILDWDYIVIGNQRKLSYVKIRECVSERSADGFVRSEVEQYRVLRLEDGVYTVQVYRAGNEEQGKHIPTDYNGNTWDYIPFTFCGALDNSDEIHTAPLLDLADINLAHYRNSADVEDSGFLVGQPVFSMPNITDAQYALLQDEKQVAIGSHRMFPTKIEIVQAQENTLIGKLMQDKWTQMKEMGARLIEVGSANKTATQSENESSIQHSVVSLAVSNVSEALTMALHWVARFALPDNDLSFDELSYTISQDFNKPTFSEERAKRLYEAAVARNIPFSLWFGYEQTGVFTEDSWDVIEQQLIDQGLNSPTAGISP